ncbi:hypothetical protein RG47T_2173 [Mucilaginibacter polytrichastri]|uniref:Cytochrome oxidase subunit I profile domain-containing protein n=1 Tax=Mucilaginibacter polytrichastri TaxID=1302689 RepID=A0A1Q5ZY82_9SPHI|nr:hypothetical protein RG47T_2173 [Mucilaginibacter polytrichastri]
MVYIIAAFVSLLSLAFWLLRLSSRLKKESNFPSPDKSDVEAHINDFEAGQLKKILDHKNYRKLNDSDKSDFLTKSLPIAFLIAFTAIEAHAQAPASTRSPAGSPGMIIMLVLIFIPLVATVFFICLKLSRLVRITHYRRIKQEARLLAEKLADANHMTAATHEILLQRKQALDFKLSNYELEGHMEAADRTGLLRNIAEVSSPRFISSKRSASPKHNIDPRLVKLILWYLGTAAFWLVLGTSIGEYMGIKFVSPDVDHVSWLSFGRLRPVHTNMVFWGWSSLAMIGLGYYVVPTVSNTPIANIKHGYVTLVLMNSAVVAGTLLLLNGINNGGGEYREYIWPAMALFASGIITTLYNFIRTVARRATKEIYISNWYIVAALMFLVVIVLVGYLPWWQNGLGETVVQGYYMHQAVGMWFMLFNLGLIYYFLPQQLNTPIYSYSLGILAFWTQILFYTTIGSHHFIFSAIPWWLQTVAIVGSMGMLIPVFSGTTNFLMTFRGNFYKIARTYTLPFYLVGIIFYFIGSTQGTAEAFRDTNLIWHFTDFAVAHSHITMYGIIAFLLWGFIYTLVPRLTGHEPRQSLVGAHFWLALIGILFYTIPLMIGGTLKGMSWMAGKPFIDGVMLMAPYWLWRAIGGSLMWTSHLFFAWNLYVMIAGRTEPDIREEIISQMDHLPVETNL